MQLRLLRNIRGLDVYHHQVEVNTAYFYLGKRWDTHLAPPKPSSSSFDACPAHCFKAKAWWVWGTQRHGAL